MNSYLIETDILSDYLLGRDRDTVLTALQSGSCYTTMYNAMELFRASRNETERQAVKDLLSAVRVLGFHFRYADEFTMIASRIEKEKTDVLSDREILIIGMAEVSKLIILTRTQYDRYRHLVGNNVKQSASAVPIE